MIGTDAAGTSEQQLVARPVNQMVVGGVLLDRKHSAPFVPLSDA
jgi:hypothetical protein